VARSGETTNISSAGVSFELMNEIQPGERIEYVITLLSSVHQVKVRCLGKVVRSGRNNDADYGFAIAVTIDRYHFVRSEQAEVMSAAF
jgi:hypothetical protein